MLAESEDVCSTLSVTRTSLLEGLERPENRTVWRQFVDRYRPPILRYAQNRFGLNSHDAEEAAQETLAVFADAYRQGRYDREKGRLRSWLFGIATNKIRELVRKRAGNQEHQQLRPTSGTGFISRIPADDAELEEMWKEEWRWAVYQQCLIEVQAHFAPQTLDAFRLFARQGMPAKEVAAVLGMTENAVYLAKHKILKRIRELVPAVEQAWQEAVVSAEA